MVIFELLVEKVTVIRSRLSVLIPFLIKSNLCNCVAKACLIHLSGSAGAKLQGLMTSSKLRFRAYFDDVVQQMVIQYAEDLFIQGKKDEAKEILETALELMTSANQANIDCEYLSIFSGRLVHWPYQIGHYQQVAKRTQF